MSFFRPSELHELDRRVLAEIDALDDRIAEDVRNSEGDLSYAEESLTGSESRYPDRPEVAAAWTRLVHHAKQTVAESAADGRDQDEQEPHSQPPSRDSSIIDDSDPSVPLSETHTT